MDIDTFTRRAHEAFESIPEEFREGVDGLTILSETLPHPSFADVYTLGQCLTEAYPSDWTGPETLRSVLALYHGSFQALAASDQEFDWEGELWETLTHELRHHLESLANEDALEGVDYAMEEAFKREEGEEFDPQYYRAGAKVAEGLFQVEYDYFLEQLWDPVDFLAAEVVEFPWHGAQRRIPRPEVLGDIHFVWIHGLEVGPGSLQLVLLRKRGWTERMKALGAKEGLEMWESEAEVLG
jgi:predicted Zn-dependent protease with MMP-like domain